MPLIERKPTVPKPDVQNTPKVQPEIYKTAVYEETNKPFQSMIAYVDGAPWSVEYYSQIVGKHSELKPIDTSASGVHQSYRHISNLEIRVTSALSDNYNAETSTMRTSGTGHIYGGVVPNVDDHFVTETNDRELTIFKIDSVEALSASRDTVYEVTYSVISRVSESPDIYKSITGKVAQEYAFIKNRINEGNSPLVVKEDYNKLLNLQQAFKDILDYYMSTFWSKGNRMMVLPGQSKLIYDYNNIEFLFKIADPCEHNSLLGVVRAPNVPSVFADQDNIFDALIKRSYQLSQNCNNTFALVRADAGGNNAWICGPAFYDIDYIVYPKNPDTTAVVSGTRPLTLASWKFEATKRKGQSFIDPENDVVAIPNGTVPLIKPACSGDYYVLSEDFYTGGSNLSGLEILVRDYLKNSTLSMDILTKIISRYPDMVRMDQFYYGPIILLLIKEASRKIYS